MEKENTISPSCKEDAESLQGSVRKTHQSTQRGGQTVPLGIDNRECHLYGELCATALDFQSLGEEMKKHLTTCRDSDYRSVESLYGHLCNSLNLRFSDIDRLGSFLNGLRNVLHIVGEKGQNGAYFGGEI